MFCLEGKATAAWWTQSHCGRSDLGGEQTQRSERERNPRVTAKSSPAQKSPCGSSWSADPLPVCGEGRCPAGSNGHLHCRDRRGKGQTSGEGYAEITSGRATSQQGLAATCKDQPYKARPKSGEREVVWHMGPYERRRRSNALRSGIKYRSRVGNTVTGQRDPGRLAVAGDPRTQIRIRSNLEVATSSQANQQRWGVYVPAFKPHCSWEGLGRKCQGQNRTREIRPSGIAGGSWETRHHGETRNPHRTLKGRMWSLLA
jgi:hypothetical protein